MEVKTINIENEFLMASVMKNIWCVLCPQFGEDTGKKGIKVLSFYSLKYFGALFRNYLSVYMDTLGCKPCHVDQYLGMKPYIDVDDSHK